MVSVVLGACTQPLAPKTLTARAPADSTILTALRELPPSMSVGAIIHVPTDADLQAVASANHGAVLVLEPHARYVLPAALSLHGHVLYGRGAELCAGWTDVTNCLVGANDAALLDVRLSCDGRAEIALMSAGDVVLAGCEFLDYTLKGTQCHANGRNDARVLVTDCRCSSMHIQSGWSAHGFQADGRAGVFASVEFDNLQIGTQRGGKEPRFAVKLAQVRHVRGDVHCGHQHVVFSEGVGTFDLTLHELAWSSSHEGLPRGWPGLWFYPSLDAVELGRNRFPANGLDGLRFAEG